MVLIGSSMSDILRVHCVLTQPLLFLTLEAVATMHLSYCSSNSITPFWIERDLRGPDGFNFKL